MSFPDSDNVLAGLSVQSKFLEQSPGQKGKMDRGDCCNVTKIDRLRHLEVEDTLTRHSEQPSGVPAGAV
jgi:hypothetical protein